MSIRNEVRAIEEHLKTFGATNEKLIEIISAAQGMTKDEHSITVLAIVKNRIIHSLPIVEQANRDLAAICQMIAGAVQA